MSRNPWEIPDPSKASSEEPSSAQSPGAAASSSGSQGGADDWALPASESPTSESPASESPAAEPTPPTPPTPQAPPTAETTEFPPQYDQPGQWDEQPASPTEEFPPQYGYSQTTQYSQSYAQSAAPQPTVVKPAKKSRKKVFALVAAVVLLIAGGTAAYFVPGMMRSQAAMSYISASDPGPDPFMDTPTDQQVLSQFESASMSGVAAQSGAVDGSDPNIYGGSGSMSVCDAEQLIANLSGNEQLNAAFASGVGVNAADVPRFIRSLQPMVLMQDTWVTNHGFAGGRATPFQAVLQRGTAVLVDAYGVPRVRCSCGNPLAEAWSGYTAPSAINSGWQNYDARQVVVIYESNEVNIDRSVTNIDTGYSTTINYNQTQIDDLAAVREAVTEDTPMTTPKDMKVKPDGRLLSENGLAQAGKSGGDIDDASVRPSGSQRFSDYNEWAETGFGGVESQDAKDSEDSQDSEEGVFPDWRSQTQPVDAGQFSVSADSNGNHFIPFPDHGVGCIVDDRNGSILCHIKSLVDTGLKENFMQRNNAANTWQAPIDMLRIYEGQDQFNALASETDSPLYAYRDVPPLEAGQSVQIGDYECFNLGDSMGCERPESRFYVDSDGKVFVNDSQAPIGATCGEVTDDRSGESYNVVVTNGAVDCAEALESASGYVNSFPSDKSWNGTIHDFGQWKCATTGGEPDGQALFLTNCVRSDDAINQFQVHFK